MSAEKIANRYAASLLELTAGNKDLQDQIDQNLFELSKLFDEKEIKKVLSSPVVNADLLKDVFANALGQLKAPELLKQYIRVLIHARRSSLIPAMNRAFRKLLQLDRGFVEATVVTAVPLKHEEFEQIRVKVEGLVGKKVLLDAQIDKSILGGFVIRIDNSLLDMSLKTKLDNMTKFAVS